MSCQNCNGNLRQNYPNRNSRNAQMCNNMNARNNSECENNARMNSRIDNYRKCEQNQNMSCGMRERSDGRRMMDRTAGCGMMNKREECNMREKTDGCGMEDKMDGCDIGSEHVDKMMPAMAYVPWQQWKDVYDIEDALCHGTIFEELNKPYIGRCR